MAAKGLQSNTRLITRAYATLLVTLMIVISFATISVVGIHLVRSKQATADQLISTLENSFSDYKPDWDYWRDTAPVNVHNTFVRVKVVHDDKPNRRYYLRGTADFLADQWESWPLLHNIQYRPDQGLFYHESVRERYNQKTWVTYEVWLSLNNIIELFKLILVIVISTTLLGFVVGIWLISLLAKRINKPLEELTADSQQIATSDTDYHQELPVFNSSREVHDLSLAFNHLLRSLNDRIRRDHQFVSDASHELRTPLAAIRGHSELLRRHAKQHPEIIPDSVAMISNETLKMQHLIESLLQLSRMDHTTFKLADFDLTDMVHQVTATFQEQMPQELLTQGPAQVTAYANNERVEQILVALLENASKYSPENSTITVKIRTTTDWVDLSVCDQGRGVSDDDKEKIFDRFYRVDSSRSQKIAGSGLGLAIAHQLATLNHARLVVTDNLPQGSCFTLVLPRNQAVSAANPGTLEKL